MKTKIPNNSPTPIAPFSHFLTSYLLAIIFGATLTFALFLRQNPYGSPYVLDIWHYMPHALFYMVFGLTVLALPFLIISQFTKLCLHRALYYIQSGLLAISLLIQHIDNEILRYVNVHITADFFRTYLMGTGAIPDSIWTLLANDAGGSYLSLILLALPPIYLVLTIFLYPSHSINISAKLQKPFIATVALLFITLPVLFYTPLFGSKNRQAKVAPPAVVIYRAIEESLVPEVNFDSIQEDIKSVQSRWLAEEGNPAWGFSQPQTLPLRKKYNAECHQNDFKYNIILISVESLRAKSLKLFNPEEKFDAAPMLTQWALSENSAYFTRYYTNAHPTIGGFMALHTGLLPHSYQTTAQKFTALQIESYASILRKHGYETIFFGGSDPDWDNQRHWLSQWYDTVKYSPDYKEQDRLVMQDVSRFLKQRNHEKPFVLTVFLISNHVPFNSPEEKFKISNSDDLTEKIHNTIRYDDDVLNEFINDIKNEPWYDKSIILITADHGMDLGDRGQNSAYYNLRREVTAIPLIIHGKHPRLPHGEQRSLSSHIDIAPTILDLLAVCDDNDFLGHSLLSVKQEREIYAIKQRNFAVETPAFSAYFPHESDPMLFSSQDLWQNTNIAKQKNELTQSLKNSVTQASKVTDYIYQNALLGSP